MAQDFATSGYPPMIGQVLSVPAWLDYVAGYDFGPLAPSRLVLHHTYRPNEAEWRGFASMRGMQTYYAGLGWNAAPHIYCGPDGIWLFTPMSEIGIHAGTGNGSLREGWYSIGLEMVGFFDTVRPAGNVWEFAKAVMGGLSRRLGIDPRRLISFHRDYTDQKSCPGWAVTKDWVWGEVEAWMNNVAPPPPPPPGQIGKPTPSDELLLETLLTASYGQRAQGYNSEWAFHQYAVSRSLGMPFSNSANLDSDGKTYNYQVFAHDTLFCEVPNWGEVQTLSSLLGGSIPPGGLGRALLDATYRAGGTTFHPEWAFHQYAMSARLGPPVGDSGIITVDGVEYAYQAFAVDTLYNRVPDWSDVRRLSQIAGASDPGTVRLREALLAETYRRAGADYRPDWAFHQLARQFNIGAPLANPYQLTLNTTTYNLQVYALDTLYNIVPDWGDVRRLNDLATHQGMPPLGVNVADVEDGFWELPQEQYSILHYSPASPAFSSRKGSRVEMVIVHGVAGAAADTLTKMSTFGAHFSTHFYVASDGTIYQLVDEREAAWHAGFATLNKIWYNINRTSIGIGLERPAEWPAVYGASSDAQRDALCWLLRRLARSYQLETDDIVLWSSLAGSEAPGTDGLPIEAMREALL